MQQNSDYIRLAADLTSDSIVDGPGLRAVLWTQGCAHHCPQCQNPQTWDFNGGALVPLEEVYAAIDELENQAGLTISGGDPMYQPSSVLKVVRYARSKGLNIWLYTGFTYEEIMILNEKNPVYQELLREIDVLVDGRFELDKMDENVLFRGSTNQRLIDVPKTLEIGEIVLVDERQFDELDKFTNEFDIINNFQRVPTYV